MRKYLFTCLFLSFINALAAQDWNELSNLKARLAVSRADTGRINLLLQIAEFEIFKPGEYKIDLDSAEAFIASAIRLNQTIRSQEAGGYIIIEQSYLSKDRNDKKNGLQLMEKAVQALSQTPGKFLLAKAYQGMSDYYSYIDSAELVNKIKYLQTAADIFKAAGYFEQAGYCNKAMAEIVPDEEQGLLKMKEALRLYQLANYKKLQGVYDLFGQYYYQKNDLKMALSYFLKALQTAHEEHEQGGTLCEIENHIGMLYSRTSDLDNEAKYIRMALTDARSINDINSAVTITLNLSGVYLKLHQPTLAQSVLQSVSPTDLLKVSPTSLASFYRNSLFVCESLKDFTNGDKYSARLEQVVHDSVLAKRTKGQAYRALASYYIASKQYDAAKPYLHLVELNLQESSSAVYETFLFHQMSFRLDSALHNYRSALYHASQELIYQDSLNKIQSLKDLQNLQSQFEIKEKESQISLLQQTSLLENKNLQQANLVKNYTLAGVVLMLIIAGLLFRQNIFKQRSNKIISANNNLLQKLVVEKEWLLKEVHHRVKNNLHTVICLLESQAAYLENDALKAIESSQHRIYAMSLIHQKLYQTEDVKTIDMDVYLTEFAGYLNDSFGNPDNIQLKTNVQPVKLSIVQAIPIGLVVNEAITNAFKYAFPNNSQGTITVTLREVGGLAELIIKDDGIGIPEATDERQDSLGMALIEGLTGDLNGRLNITADNGTAIRVLFEPKHFN